MSALDELATRSGIALDYEDYRGRRRVVPDEAKRAVLAALGWPATTDTEIGAAISALEDQAWRATLPPAIVVRAGQACELTVTHEASAGELSLDWELIPEHGEARSGTLRAR